MENQLLSITDVAQALGVSQDTVRRLIARSKLRSVRVCRRILVPVEEVRRICQGGDRPDEVPIETRRPASR